MLDYGLRDMPIILVWYPEKVENQREEILSIWMKKVPRWTSDTSYEPKALPFGDV
jgi:hypothetical protein